MVSRSPLRSAAARLMPTARRAPEPSASVPPPACPAGWTTGPPDFVGLGSQRCGTSWWFDMVTTHPGVSRAPGSAKEVHFFDRYCTDAAPADLAGQYHRHFPRPTGYAVGEWTPRYLYDFWVPPLLRQAAPGARFLVLLRDPVERFWSGVAHERSKPAPPDALFLSSDAYSRGLYHHQLQRLFRTVDADRVLVLQYERCSADPEGELLRTYEFLGLDVSQAVLPSFALRVNGTPPGGPELPARLRSALGEAYADDARALSQLVPDLDLALWPNLKDLA